jgi:hypothetical protein
MDDPEAIEEVWRCGSSDGFCVQVRVQEDESERSSVKGALRRRGPWTFDPTDVDSDKIGIWFDSRPHNPVQLCCIL